MAYALDTASRFASTLFNRMVVIVALVLSSNLSVECVQAASVQRVVSPGGIEAWLVEEHAIPIVSLRFSFRGGAALDPEGKEGMARLVSGLLDEGAGGYDSQAFQSRLDDLAVRMGFSAGMDTFSGSMETLSENLPEAFEMLALAITAPRFEPSAVNRIRSQVLASLAQVSTDPDYIAARNWLEHLLPEHPYGRPTRGTPDSVQAVGIDDLRKFVSERFDKDNLVVGVVGDIDADQLEVLLDSTFGALPERATPYNLEEANPVDDGDKIIVEFKIPQSIVVFGHTGPKRNHPDFYAAYVMNHILGGGSFTSRLTQEVRKKRGLAYGIGTSWSPKDFGGFFRGRVATQNARVAETIEIILAEISRMRAGGANESELADAKTFLTGSFPLRLDSNSKIASMLVAIQLDDLGIDYLERRNDYIDAVTLDDVRKAAAKFLKPDELVFVVVGMPEGLTITE